MEEIANEYLKTKNSSWDYYVDTNQDFKDISLDKVDKFIKRIEKNFDKSFVDSPMQILQKYGLVRDDKITFGAYLLIVKDFCLISGIQAGRFKTSTDIIDSISLNRDILSSIAEKQQQYSWGKSIVKPLSDELRKEFVGIKGFSERN